jgi:hypothetical protein
MWHAWERSVVYRFWRQSLKERETTRKKRRRWEDGIRIDLRKTGWGEGVDWIRLVQDRDRWRAVVSEVMNLRVLASRS